jgi:hypothetical protein
LEHLVVASMEEPNLAAQLEAPVGAERERRRRDNKV